jgi:hypothetical protein
MQTTSYMGRQINAPSRAHKETLRFEEQHRLNHYELYDVTGAQNAVVLLLLLPSHYSLIVCEDLQFHGYEQARKRDVASDESEDWVCHYDVARRASVESEDRVCHYDVARRASVESEDRVCHYDVARRASDESEDRVPPHPQEKRCTQQVRGGG